MKILLTILKWSFGISFIIIGLTTIDFSILNAIIFFILGLFITPISYNFIVKKSNIKLPSWAKWIITIIGCMYLYSSFYQSFQENAKEVNLIIKKANALMDKGEIDSAKIYIDKAKGRLSQKAIILEKKLIEFKSEETAIDTLVSMTDKEFSQLKKGKLAKTYFSQKYLNTNFIGLMKKLAPQRAIIVKSKELEAEKKERQEKKARRKKLIDKQFSAWDGSHPKLSRMLKDNSRNPDSYEHIETIYKDFGKYLLITTSYRGQNGFGGMSIGKVTARVDFNGNVLEIVSEE